MIYRMCAILSLIDCTSEDNIYIFTSIYSICGIYSDEEGIIVNHVSNYQGYSINQ